VGTLKTFKKLQQKREMEARLQLTEESKELKRQLEEAKR